jgi:hypothetical protein
VAVEMILTDELAVILQDRNPGIVLPFPVLARINIMNDNLEPAKHERQ